jgi:ATP-dependent RNA helicase RhlE
MTFPAFAELGLAEPLLRALAGAGYTRPTPIQTRAIPAVLAGRDLIAIAQTGTGKTAAFALPILDRLHRERPQRRPRQASALMLAPTRELAIQIAQCVTDYGRYLELKHATVVGGVPQRPQVKALARGVDVLVATPGRLLDLVAQGQVSLGKVRYLVLDEADRMLDMGFIPDIRRIVALLPENRQGLLFSATMPPPVERLGRDHLRAPMRIDVAPQAITVDKVTQQVHHVASTDKMALLTRLLAAPELSRVIVFTRTKHGANRVAKQLGKAGIAVDALHGNKSQGARQRALERFRDGRARVLVATDIAARGIDVDEVSHVINFELPNLPESYVHRIGRTARAGAAGTAVSFCDVAESTYLNDIERLTGLPLQVVGKAPSAMPGATASRKSGRQRRRRVRSRRLAA